MMFGRRETPETIKKEMDEQIAEIEKDVAEFGEKIKDPEIKKRFEALGSVLASDFRKLGQTMAKLAEIAHPVMTELETAERGTHAKNEDRTS